MHVDRRHEPLGQRQRTFITHAQQHVCLGSPFLPFPTGMMGWAQVDTAHAVGLCFS